MKNRLEEKVAVVTGAASGIGRAISERLISEGARILAVDKDTRLLSELEQAHAGVVAGIAVDLVDRGAPAAIFSKCLEAFGKLDILVNNAGRGKFPTVQETTDEDLDLCFEINFLSTFRMSRAAIPLLPRGGCIVNIASSAGVLATPGNAAYAAAKAAVLALTRQLAVELGPLGIRVNSINPGLTATPATQARVDDTEFLRKFWSSGVPLERPGQPHEIAAAAAFLSSDDASFITGEALFVDAGFTTTRYRAG